MDEKAVHMQKTCVYVCVHMCAYVCLSLQVHFALQRQCAELPEPGRKKNNFSPLILLKTPCAASELLLM